MPFYSAKSSNLLAIGPILDVQVMPTKEALWAMKKAGQSAPAPITISAMIDTGASGSVIKTGIPSQLNLRTNHEYRLGRENVPILRRLIAQLQKAQAGNVNRSFACASGFKDRGDEDGR